MELNDILADYLENLGYSIAWVDDTGIMLRQGLVYLVDVREDVRGIVNGEHQFRGLRVSYDVRQTPEGIFIEQV